MPSCRLLASLNVGLSVCGVAQLRHRIFVVCLESDVIHVYSDSPPFNRLSDIRVTSMDDPNDIAASAASDQLFVADWGYHCVWKLRLTFVDDDDLSCRVEAEKWITVISPWAVSMGSSGRLLITPRIVIADTPVADSGDRAGLCLFDVKSDGSSPTARIPLPAGLNVEHAVETSRRTYLICYNLATESRPATAASNSGSSGGVCELNGQGMVLSRFEADDNIQLEWPRHLLLLPSSSSGQSQQDKLLVSDFGSLGSVVLFENGIASRPSLLVLDKNNGAIRQPRRLSWQQTTGHLLVGQYTGLVGVYTFLLQPISDGL